MLLKTIPRSWPIDRMCPAAMMELRGALQQVELETRFVSDAMDPAIAEALHESSALGAEEHSTEART